MEKMLNKTNNSKNTEFMATFLQMRLRLCRTVVAFLGYWVSFIFLFCCCLSLWVCLCLFVFVDALQLCCEWVVLVRIIIVLVRGCDDESGCWVWLKKTLTHTAVIVSAATNQLEVMKKEEDEWEKLSLTTSVLFLYLSLTLAVVVSKSFSVWQFGKLVDEFGCCARHDT